MLPPMWESRSIVSNVASSAGERLRASSIHPLSARACPAQTVDAPKQRAPRRRQLHLLRPVPLRRRGHSGHSGGEEVLFGRGARVVALLLGSGASWPRPGEKTAQTSDIVIMMKT